MNEAKCGLDDWFAAGRTVLELDEYFVDTLPKSGDDWEVPTPLDDPTGPPFPLDALPGPIGTYVAAVAEETQTAVDMAANVALGTLSAAAGGKYEVVLPDNGWSEPVHGQFVTGAEPAQRKTQIFRRMTKPIVDYEREVNPEERRALAQWESRERELEHQMKAAERGESTSQDGVIRDTDAVRMVAADALEAHRADRPQVTQIIIDDATPEVVKSRLAEQGGAIAAMSAESTFLSNTAGGRYSDGPNLDVLLNGHAADSIRVDRRGRPSETIERPCLTLCLMLQPEVFRDIGKSPGFMARGGAARFLASFPADMLGRRRIDVQPISLDLADAWASLVTGILRRIPDMQDGSFVPWVLRLSDDAKAVFRVFRTSHESQMGLDGELADIRDWAGKQPSAVLRIAGLLHIARHDVPEAVPINGDTMHRAIRIAGYYADHARIMYRLMRGQSSHDAARTVLAAIRESGSLTTRREVHRRLRGRTAFQLSEDLEEPLHVLENYGYIRRYKLTGDRGGRSSECIEMNPLADMDKTDTTSRNDHQSGYDRIGKVMSIPSPDYTARQERDDELIASRDEEAWAQGVGPMEDPASRLAVEGMLRHLTI